MTPEDQIFTKVAADVITQVVKDSGETIWNWIGMKSEETDLFNRTAREYCEKLYGYLNVIKIIGMDSPESMSDIYVKAFLHSQTIDSTFHTLDEVRSKFKANTKEYFASRERVDISTILNLNENLVVLGKPGAGKSMLLKHAAIEVLKTNSMIKIKKIPVFLSLREFARSRKSLFTGIIEQFGDYFTSGSDSLWIDLLNDGKFLILLDGFDEVQSGDHNLLLRNIEDFIKKDTGNQLIISCRSGAYKNEFSRFTNVEVADFDLTDIKDFVLKWFKGEEEAKSVYASIASNISFRELATNPLLLTLICIVYGQRKGVPSNRAQLYDLAVETLVENWDISKHVERENKDQTKIDIINVIQNVGYKTFVSGQYILPRRTLSKYVTDALGPESNITGDQFIKLVEINHGIFVRRSRDIYSYSHLTFQEYFAAKVIAEKLNKENVLNNIKKIVSESKWREVLGIVAGLLPTADFYILEIRNMLNRRLEMEPKVTNILSFAESIMKIDESQIINRLVCIYLIIVSLGREYNKYGLLKSRLVSTIKYIESSGHERLSDAFNSFICNVFKRQVDGAEYLVDRLVVDLEVSTEVAHRILYVIDYEKINNFMSGFSRYRYMNDTDFVDELNTALDIAKTYNDCLNADPYLSQVKLSDLKFEAFTVKK